MKNDHVLGLPGTPFFLLLKKEILLLIEIFINNRNSISNRNSINSRNSINNRKKKEVPGHYFRGIISFWKKTHSLYSKVAKVASILQNGIYSTFKEGV